MNLSIRPSRARRRGSAFTMIEILVAIGVIVVLMSIIFVALKHSVGSAKSKQTTITLQNLASMYAELETIGTTKATPAGWYWWQDANDGAADGVIDANNANVITAGLSLWKLPYGLDAMPAPGQMADEVNVADTSTRQGNLLISPAVLNTQIAMSFLLSPASNRESFGKIADNQKMQIPVWSPGLKYDAPGADGWLGYGTDGTLAVANYLRGIKVVSGTTLYRCAPAGTALTTNSAPPTDWVTDARNVPIALDGWGHPIIFVPATGLRVQLLNGKSKYDSADNTQCAIILAPPGKSALSTAAPPLPYVVSAGRPFFASAGPDGDFSKGDDNLYSFESP